MAIQGCRPRRKPNGTGGIFEGNQDILPTGDFVNGLDEGRKFHEDFGSALLSYVVDERGRRS